MTGLKISHPLSKEFSVGFSQNVPGELPHGPRSVVQVRAGAERPARTGDDRHPGVLVVAEPREGVVEVAPHFAVDRVEDVGPVVRDGGHMTIESVRGRITHRTSVCHEVGLRDRLTTRRAAPRDNACEGNERSRRRPRVPGVHGRTTGTAVPAPRVFRGLVAEVEGSDPDEPTYTRYIRRMGHDGWLGLGWPVEYGGQARGPSIR